jgi:hypothetical protein
MTELRSAGVYVYGLGTHNNFAVDREATIVRSKTLPDAQLQGAARRRERFLFVTFAIRRLPASDSSSISARDGLHCRYKVCGTLRKRVGRPK